MRRHAWHSEDPQHLTTQPLPIASTTKRPHNQRKTKQKKRNPHLAAVCDVNLL